MASKMVIISRQSALFASHKEKINMLSSNKITQQCTSNTEAIYIFTYLMPHFRTFVTKYSINVGLLILSPYSIQCPTAKAALYSSGEGPLSDILINVSIVDKSRVHLQSVIILFIHEFPPLTACSLAWNNRLGKWSWHSINLFFQSTFCISRSSFLTLCTQNFMSVHSSRHC